MIRVRVELISAVTGKTTELARMDIANRGGEPNPRRGNYEGWTYQGRCAAALDAKKVARMGTVDQWRRLDRHVWELVAHMLKSMRYIK